MQIKTDYLVIGSGMAGLSFAIKMAEYYEQKNQEIRIDIFSKATLDESNTKYAQGGIAAVQNKIKDSFEKHINDTLDCGSGLPDKKTVELVVKAAPDQIDLLIKWGTSFDKTPNGDYDLVQEGGHSEKRILHHKDVTGLEIEKTLLKKVKSFSSIKLHYNHFALDLFVENNECLGALIVNSDTNDLYNVYSSYTLLATGGVGQVYERTTNPKVATGDGIAMAKRAGAKIKGMEFIQFHPTALYSESNPSFLISEAVRGFGAILTNNSKEDFCIYYDDRASLAPRDIVARAIAFEMKKNNSPFVNLSLGHLDIDVFKNHFPNIYQRCEEENIDIKNEGIPVVPAAHYLCGGVVVNQYGETNIKGLLACGECANTGLHGANRLASNSLLEAIAYADFCFDYAIKNKRRIRISEQQRKSYPYMPKSELNASLYKLKELMANYANIVKSPKGLQIALGELEQLESEIKLGRTSVDIASVEYLNMLIVAKLIVKQAIARKENIGLHYLEANFDL